MKSIICYVELSAMKNNKTRRGMRKGIGGDKEVDKWGVSVRNRKSREFHWEAHFSQRAKRGEEIAMGYLGKAC